MFKIIFLFFLIPVGLFGQSNLKKISGKIIDNDNSPVPFAYISLLQEKDSMLLETTLTDVNGNYELRILPDKKYLIRARCLGFKDYFLLLSDGIIDYNMVLIPSENQLKEVEISSHQSKSPIQFQTDKTQINIAESANSSGTDIFELLRKSPGIKITGDDKILIEGKDGVRVYIDGTLVNLKGSDLSAFLKEIQTSNIEKLEIISNPSAKYDADGKGIIHIKTKKGTAKGLNSNVSLNASLGNYYPKYNAGISLNYRNKNVNIFGNCDYSFRTNKNSQDYLRKQNNADEILTTYNQIYSNDTKRQGSNFRTGIDIFLTTNSTLGFLFNGNINSMQNNSLSNTEIYQDVSSINSTLTAKNNQLVDNNLFGYNLNYKYAGPNQRSFTIDANHTDYNYKSNSNQPNYYTDNTGNLTDEKIYQNFASTSIQINSIKSDYTQKIFKGNLDLGVKASKVESDNNLDYFNVVNDTFIADTGKTNEFIYSEIILAAYTNYSLQLEKWSCRVGFRVEHTSNDATLSSMINEKLQAVNTNYNNFFPNALISYQFNPNNAISFLYNKNIDRPAYQELNPFVFVYDELSSSKGNPFLKPQIADNFKLSHIFKKKITSSVSFTNTKDYILLYRDTVMGKTFVSNININHQRIYNLGISVQQSFMHWWDFFASLNVFRQEIGGIVGKTILNMSSNSLTFSANNTFSFLKNWKIEFSGFVNPEYLDAPAIVNMQWSMDIGISRKMLNDAGSIRLTITDIFNSLDFSLSRDFGGLYYTNRNKWESQQLKLSFNYKFGNKNLKPVNEREKGSKEEEKRIK
jgi:outer membrane receptor protein involved in Fe transport